MIFATIKFSDLLNQIKEANLEYSKLNFENRTIIAFKDSDIDRRIFCFIFPIGEEGPASKIKDFINLGECNDGGKFTSVGQAVNQAKIFITCTNNRKQ